MYARLNVIYNISNEDTLSQYDEFYNDTQESINFYESLLRISKR